MELALIGVVLLAGKLLNDRKKRPSTEEYESGGLLEVEEEEPQSIMQEVKLPSRNISDFKLNTFANNSELKKKDVVINDLSKLKRQSTISSTGDTERLRQLKNDYTMSNNGEKRHNLPFEQIKVGKEDLNRDVRITPKTIDETRLNPKVQHQSRINTGRSNIEKEQMTKITEKRRPEQFVHADVHTFTVPTSQIKKDSMTGEIVNKATNRQDTTSDYMGNAFMSKSVQIEKEFQQKSQPQLNIDYQTNLTGNNRSQQRNVSFIDSFKNSLASLNPLNYVSKTDNDMKSMVLPQNVDMRDDNNQNNISSNITTNVNKNLVAMSEIIPPSKQHLILNNQNSNVVFNEKNLQFVPEVDTNKDTLQYDYTMGTQATTYQKGTTSLTSGKIYFTKDGTQNQLKQIIENQTQKSLRNIDAIYSGKEDILGEHYGNEFRYASKDSYRSMNYDLKESNIRESYGQDIKYTNKESSSIVQNNIELEKTLKDTSIREVYGSDINRIQKEGIRNNIDIDPTLKEQLVREIFGQDLAFQSKEQIRNTDFSLREQVHFENYGNLSLTSKEILRTIDNSTLGATLKEQLHIPSMNKNINLATKEMIRNMDNESLGATVKEMTMKSVFGSNIGTASTITIRDDAMFDISHDHTQGQEMGANLLLAKKSRIFDYNQKLINVNKEHNINYLTVDSSSKKSENQLLVEKAMEETLPYSTKENSVEFFGHLKNSDEGQYKITANNIEAPYTIKQNKISYTGNAKGLENKMSYEASENAISNTDRDMLLKLRNPNITGKDMGKDSTFNGKTETRLGHLTLPEHKIIEISNKEERNKMGKVNLSDRERFEIIDTYRNNPINIGPSKSLHDSVHGRFLYLGK